MYMRVCSGTRVSIALSFTRRGVGSLAQELQQRRALFK
jgi:hypothetical protein